jgi:hypothetical protein
MGRSPLTAAHFVDALSFSDETVRRKRTNRPIPGANCFATGACIGRSTKMLPAR